MQSLRKAGIHAAGAGSDLAEARAPAVLRLNTGHRLLVFSWAARSSGVPPEWAAATASPGIALLHDLSERGVQQVAAAVARDVDVGMSGSFLPRWAAQWRDGGTQRDQFTRSRGWSAS